MDDTNRGGGMLPSRDDPVPRRSPEEGKRVRDRHGPGSDWTASPGPHEPLRPDRAAGRPHAGGKRTNYPVARPYAPPPGARPTQPPAPVDPPHGPPPFRRPSPHRPSPAMPGP